MRAAQICRSDLTVVIALARHGRSQTLNDLAAHDCLLYQLNGRIYVKWRFPMDNSRCVPCDPTPLYFVCPHRKQFSPAVRRLYDALKTRCEQRIAAAQAVSGPSARAARLRRRPA